ncbi:MAG TPA: AMP-binding protein [Sediminibacterium sp.]|uniref:AMP-binding protein n=1 Tax=Sediminibacterium sp. TaxID=1917865 RepID=UPI000AE10582|nr:AMP-binding protein [Sediminibacterium sp.]HLD53080.1 AMP-binding protein [Sediminibacterium sp.]
MSIFFNDLGKHQNSIVFTTIDEQISYNDLVFEIEKLSENLLARKLAFIICENNIESVLGYLTFLRIGIVPLLVSKSIDRELLNDLITNYKPNYIWANKDYTLSNDWKITHSNRTFQLQESISPFNHEFHPSLALLLMTSGSTGSPVLVRLSYQNLIQNTISISDSLGISKEDKPITTLPMNYTFGLSIINSHLLNGCEIILTELSILSKDFWDLFKSRKPTTFGGVPYTYQMLKRIGFEKMDLPFLKKLTQAGGKLDHNMSKYFAELCLLKGIKFFVMYGQTEATARMSCLPAEDAVKKAGSIGIPIPNGSFYLVDDNLDVINEADKEGELYYKGPNVSMGYAYNVNDLILGDENNGVLATGDLAKKDNEGYYYIVGRKKRFLKIFGNRISLDEIENITLKNGYSCVCTGVDDKLYVFTENEQDVLELKNLISAKISIHHSAIIVKHISKIPRNDSGKILYSELQVK